jgi:YesN/AraC family two-component response regulator
MSEPLRILCVDDEENVLHSLKRVFLDSKYEMLSATSGNDGLSILRSVTPIQVIISDYRMPGMNGVDFLCAVRDLCPDTIRIILSGYADVSAVVSAINESRIYKFISKPWNDDELRMTIAGAFEQYGLKIQNRRLTEELKIRNEQLDELNTILKERITDKIQDLKMQNSKLMHTSTTLSQLQLAVVSLSGDGLWMFYYNEKARQLFKWTSDKTLPGKRSSFFDSRTDAAIDEIVATGAGQKTVTIGNHSIMLHGERITHSDNEKSFAIVCYDSNV